MARERPADAPGDRDAPAGRSGRPLWAHALLYGVLLLAVAPLMHLGTPFTSDEGAYALQARSLREAGTWAYEYKAGDLDPERRWMPLAKADMSEDAVYPYARHPAFPRALELATRVVGERFGLYLWSLVGAVVLAVAAWLLAAEVAPGTERTAFWVAAASPVTVNAYLIWGHTLSAAVAGLAAVAAVRIARHGLSPGRGAALAAALVTGALLRSEGLLYAVAVGLALGVAVWRARGPIRAAAVAALAVVPVAVATVVETAWQRTLFGGGYTQVTGRRSAEGFLAGRVQGGWHEVLAGAVSDQLAIVLVLAALGLTVWAAVVRRREPAVAAGAVAVAAVLYVSRLVVEPQEPVTGLLAAWPLAVLGLAALPLRRLVRDRGVALVAGIAALLAGAVLATQYAEGGGWEWGGRFFFPIVAPLAVLGAVGLRRAGIARPALIALAVAPTVLGLGVVASVRSSSVEFLDEVETVAAGAPLAVTTIEHLPRAMWAADDRITWMMALPDDLPALLDDLAAQHVEEVVLVTAATVDRDEVAERFDVATDLTGPEARARGQVVLRLVGH